MAATRSPALRAQWLGGMLRDLRESNRLPLRETARFLERSASTVSRFESGALPIAPADVAALLDFYHVEGALQRSALLRLAEDPAAAGWWERYRADISPATGDRIWLEDRAERIRVFSPLAVTALLQTEAYARAVIAAGAPGAPDRQVERWVEVRMKRQAVLEGDSPARLDVLLDEAALRRPAGGPAAMRDQLAHLRASGERDNIRIRVLPFDAGAYADPVTDGGFSLIALDGPLPEVAHADGATGRVLLAHDDVTRLGALYDRLEAGCLAEAESADFLAAVESAAG
ncbi:helix-turn-helix domain-containing protein [Nocardiopsis sediminis]|uniref:Helix-turn-helix domain-containing protein n=1 Tax=Nocardiopsis sediminis TaxID=1778267 RepID=A0ABV8FFM3_9ACTN